MHVAIETPYSYPSGHAFRTLLLAAALWLTWGGGADRPRTRLRYVLIAVVVLMGAALIYLGDHWTSEVIGGYALAASCLVPLRSAARTR
jgi:undecaprenyl-diphosphatase